MTSESMFALAVRKRSQQGPWRSDDRERSSNKQLLADEMHRPLLPSGPSQVPQDRAAWTEERLAHRCLSLKSPREGQSAECAPQRRSEERRVGKECRTER